MAIVICLLPAVEIILPSKPSERLLAIVCVIMFFAGVALACQEVGRWWKARMKQYKSPPLPNLINYELDADERWRPIGVLWFRLQRGVPERSQSSERAAEPTEIAVQEKPTVANIAIAQGTADEQAKPVIKAA